MFLLAVLVFLVVTLILTARGFVLAKVESSHHEGIAYLLLSLVLLVNMIFVLLYVRQ